VVIAGTRGVSSLIDDLVLRGKLNARSLDGAWETFTLSVVDDPTLNIRRALVVAGEFSHARCL
jgi:hypothetical protein